MIYFFFNSIIYRFEKTYSISLFSGGKHFNKELEMGIPIQRIGTRQDIGDTVLYAVSDAAQLLTGTTIIADGGSWLTDSNNFYARSSMLKKYAKL